MNQELPEELRRFDESNPAVALYRIAATSPFEAIIPSFVEAAEYYAQPIEKGTAMWTENTPTKPGYYWWRYGGLSGNPRIVKIQHGAEGLWMTYFGTDMRERPGSVLGVFWPDPILCPDGSAPFIG